MQDTVFLTRLDSLLQSLNAVNHTLNTLKNRQWEQLRIQQYVWSGLDRTIGGQIRDVTRSLNSLREELVVKETGVGHGEDGPESMWSRYTRISRDCQVLFEEALELIGGMVYREQSMDQTIYHVADELVQRLSDESIGDVWQSLTVVAWREVVNNQTLARLVRLRFPEGGIWELPFAAYEYGHVLLRQYGEEMAFVQEELKYLDEHEAELSYVTTGESSPSNEQGEREVRADRWSSNQLYVLIADAFATYTMGPAYACPAIWLRFDPFVAYSDQRGTPADAKRATMVFEILKHMNTAANPLGYYADIIRILEDAWASALTSARPAGELDGAQVDYLSGLAARTFRTFLDRLSPSALYPVDGWLRAQVWVNQMHDEYLNSRSWKDRPVEELLQPLRSLREILNAAWWARVGNDSAWVREYDLAGLALNLCLAITQPPKDEGGRGRRRKVPIPPSRGGGAR